MSRPARPQGVQRPRRTLWGTLQDLNDCRTPLADFFSILLGFFLTEEERTIKPRDGDGDEFDRQQQSAHDGVRRGGR